MHKSFIVSKDFLKIVLKFKKTLFMITINIFMFIYFEKKMYLIFTLI